MKKAVIQYSLTALVLSVLFIVAKFYKNPSDKLLLKKYPEAKEIRWTTIASNSSAFFTLNNKAFTARYDNNIWIETATSIERNELPSSIHLNHVVVWKVEKVETSNGKTLFRVHIKPTKSYRENIYEYDSNGHRK